MDIQVHIHNQRLGRLDHNKVVANTNKYHFIAAQFTDDWEGCTIDCIGYTAQGEPVTFNIDDTRDNVWVVPPELIQPPAFNISFVGVKADGERITTGIVAVEVHKSGYVSGAMPEDTYPSKYEALMAEITKARTEIDTAIEELPDVIDDVIQRKIDEADIIVYSKPEDIEQLDF